jgi:hypothetical protein
VGLSAGHSTTMARCLASIIALCVLLSSAKAANRQAQGLKFLAAPSQVKLNQMISNPKVDGEMSSCLLCPA